MDTELICTNLLKFWNYSNFICCVSYYYCTKVQGDHKIPVISGIDRKVFLCSAVNWQLMYSTQRPGVS